MRRLVASALLALIAAVGVAGLAPEKASPRSEVAGTWACVSIAVTHTGLCLEDPLP